MRSANRRLRPPNNVNEIHLESAAEVVYLIDRGSASGPKLLRALRLRDVGQRLARKLRGDGCDLGAVVDRSAVFEFEGPQLLLEDEAVLLERLREHGRDGEVALGDLVVEGATDVYLAADLRARVSNTSHRGLLNRPIEQLPLSGDRGEMMTGQIWAAVIAGCIALVAIVVNTRSDSLKKAERLTGLAVAMKDSSERTLVEDLRDDYATTWALRQMAPANTTFTVLWIVFQTMSILTFIGWGLVVFVDKDASQSWWIYAGALVLGIVAAIFAALRASRRNRWMKDERSKRWMRRPFHSGLRDSIE